MWQLTAVTASTTVAGGATAQPRWRPVCRPPTGRGRRCVMQVGAVSAAQAGQPAILWWSDGSDLILLMSIRLNNNNNRPGKKEIHKKLNIFEISVPSVCRMVSSPCSTVEYSCKIALHCSLLVERALFIAEQGYLILPFSNGPFLSPSKGYVLETVGMIVHSGAKYEIMRNNLDHSRGEEYPQLPLARRICSFCVLDSIETELFYIFVTYNCSEREFPFLGLSTHVGNEQDY